MEKFPEMGEAEGTCGVYGRLKMGSSLIVIFIGVPR